MTRLILMLCIALVIFNNTNAQLRMLDYAGYSLAYFEDFDYPDPVGSYPSHAFKRDSVFTARWDVKADYPCTGWGHEMYTSSYVSMASYNAEQKGIIRLRETIYSNPTCDDSLYRGWGHIPISHLSGMLQSKFKVSLGIIESVIKLPKGTGQTAAWPAFWLYPPGKGAGDLEIDIIDNASGGDMVVANNIYRYIQNGRQWTGNTTPLNSSLSADFHKYSCVWTPSRVVFCLDELPLCYLNYEADGTPPDFHRVLFTLQTQLSTGAGKYMDIDWFKFWVQNEANICFHAGVVGDYARHGICLEHGMTQADVCC